MSIQIGAYTYRRLLGRDAKSTSKISIHTCIQSNNNSPKGTDERETNL
jgi:hypothetical protein